MPLTVAVLDVGGHLVVLKRQDGSGNLRADVAIGKAWGALGMGISSRTIRDRLKERPAFQGALAAASDGRFIPVPGGVLALNVQGEVVGAVGIRVDASDKDEYAAISGVHKAGLKSQPEQPAAKLARRRAVMLQNGVSARRCNAFMCWIYLDISASWGSASVEQREWHPQNKKPEGLRRHSGHIRVRRRPLARGLSSQHVLHVVDEGGEPQGVQGRRGGVHR